MALTNSLTNSSSHSNKEFALNDKLIDLCDSGIEFHQRRASIQSIHSFIRHLTQGQLGFNVRLARELNALNPKEYILTWEAKDENESPKGVESNNGVVKYGGFIFILQLRCKGKKQDRIKRTKEVLLSKTKLDDKEIKATKTSLPPLPLLPNLGIDPTNIVTAQVEHDQVLIPVLAPVVTASNSQLKFDPWDCLSQLKAESYYVDQSHYERYFEARAGKFAADDAMLSPRVKRVLREQWGVSKLYTHQADAIRASLQGNDVLLLTGTGSGKTLCFASVVAQRFAEQRGLTGDAATEGGGFLLNGNNDNNHNNMAALFIYPTKALAQDQLRALTLLFQREHIRIRAIDGDSTPSEREEAQTHCDVLLTNPDFLHCSILPTHATTWKSFLSRLELIVCDECHTYNGAFGCHFSLVLRRLMRLSRHEEATSLSRSSKLRFFMCSATISNPEQTFYRLVGQHPSNRLIIISEDASPQGERLVVLWRPTLIKYGRNSSQSSSLQLSDSNGEKRCSPIYESARLLSSLVQMKVRTLAFCRTRKLVELVLKYSYDILKRESPESLKKVVAYRGGYTKQSRREIERKMFSGELIGIACTSALELGIDLGCCDSVLVLGIANTSSTLQMFGRAGRNGKSALNICVTFDGALDRSYLKNPASFFNRPYEESAIFDPMNEIILKKHLLCAAREEPLDFSCQESFDLTLFDRIRSDVPRFNEEIESKMASGARGGWATTVEECMLPTTCPSNAQEFSINSKPLNSSSSRSFYSDTSVASSALQTQDSPSSPKHQIANTDELSLSQIPVTSIRSLLLEYCDHMVEDELLIPIENHPTRFRCANKVVRPYDFSLRLVESIQIKLICIDTEQCLDEIEYSRSFFELYPGAIYLHQSQTYCVLSLDLTCQHVARCKRIEVDYYTSPLDYLKVKILRIFEQKYSLQVSTGIVNLRWEVYGFKKRRFHQFGYESALERQKDRELCTLPPLEYSTRATWLDFGLYREQRGHDHQKTVVDDEEEDNGAQKTQHELDDEDELDYWGFGIHAAQHLLIKATQVLISCHHSNVSTTHDGSSLRYNRLIIIDRDPGGIGIADACYSRIDEILNLALKIGKECDCDSNLGCVNCVLDPTCSELNVKCSKLMGIRVLEYAIRVVEVSKASNFSPSKTGTTIEITPKRYRRIKNMAQERASGTTLVPMWKRHLPELGAEHVRFESEL